MKKIILLLILILTSTVHYGQSVPNTNTFNLQNVESAIAGTQGNLSTCFSNAISDYFHYYWYDQYYTNYSSRNNLLMFRNYGSHNANMTCGVSSVFSAFNNTTTTTGTIQSPSGLSNGDLIVLYITSNNGGNIIVPAGWNMYTNVVVSSFYVVGIYYKIYDGTLGSVNISNPRGGSFSWGYKTVRYSGYSTLSSAGGSNASNVSTVSGNTNVSSGAFVVGVFFSFGNFSTYSPTVSKDFFTPGANSVGTSINVIFSCAPIGLQKYVWSNGIAVTSLMYYFITIS